jgi:threonine synthase
VGGRRTLLGQAVGGCGRRRGVWLNGRGGQDLRRLMRKSYSTFTDKDVVPTRMVGENGIMELFHGPTFAFKDVALQVLAVPAPRARARRRALTRGGAGTGQPL